MTTVAIAVAQKQTSCFSVVLVTLGGARNAEEYSGGGPDFLRAWLAVMHHILSASFSLLVCWFAASMIAAVANSLHLTCERSVK